MKTKTPKEVLETNKAQNWKSCLFCGGEIVQVRKALFSCLKCNQEYIADEEDMKAEAPFKIMKINKQKEVMKNDVCRNSFRAYEF